jgi:two-component system response regulator HydG
MVKVNCATLPANLIESELFGHEKGAFTGAMVSRVGRFELANGATIFLDEIGELPLDLQAKLLRVLQEGEFERLGSSRTCKVDVRVIAATNRDLEAASRNGTFRADLYYRLHVFPISVPPLRERREDIPVLLAFFLEKYNRKMSSRARFGDGVVEAISQHDFPGNIRELENMVEQAVALSGGGMITVDDVLPATTTPTRANEGGRTLADVVDAAERQAIEATLRDCDGSRERAAEMLGISATTLWRKMTRLSITYPPV